VSAREPLRVLFVCVENSCRSQMAEAFARRLGLDAHSAGSRPSGVVAPAAVASMRELGYDLSRHASKSLRELPPLEWDYCVTMGCGDDCPLVRAKRRLDWAIPDPKRMEAAAFAKVRDEIRRRVEELAQPR
jgi:protein-tyrosine-phosphatase